MYMIASFNVIILHIVVLCIYHHVSGDGVRQKCLLILYLHISVPELSIYSLLINVWS